MNHSNMYWPEKALKEALGCKDDDILGAIKKLKEERDELKEKCGGLTADLELTHRLYKENHDFVDKVCEAVDIQRPYFESGYTNAAKLIAEIKRERDELKEKYDKLKKRTNAAYGVSCGYCLDGTPVFKTASFVSCSCTYTGGENTEIEATFTLYPNANYKGEFDTQNFANYITHYDGRKVPRRGWTELEKIDYQNAKAARAELAYLYKQVLGKEKLDRDLSPHEVMKAILDADKKREDFLRELSCSLGFGNPVVKQDNIDQKEKDILERIEGLKAGVWPCENSSTFVEYLKKEFPKFCKKYNVFPLTGGCSVHDWIQYIFDVLVQYRDCSDKVFNKAEEFRKEKQAVENVLAELRAKIREIYRSVVDDEWGEYLAYTSALNDINEEYKRVVHNFEERTKDLSKAQQELDRYRLAVGSLLGIPKETRDDINAIERAFTFSKKMYKSLQEFRDNVCEIFDIPSSMTDNYVLKEIHDVADRYDELEDFRADICGILDIEGMLGTPQQNDKYILERLEKLKGDHCDAEKEFLDGVKKRIGVNADCSDSKYMLRCLDIKLDHSSLSTFADSVYEELGLNRYGCTLTEAIDELKKRLDRYARFRSNICTALCLGGETSDEDILNAIAEDSKESNRLTVFRNDVAKAIGMTKKDTNSDIINRVVDVKERHDKLCKDYTELRKAIWEAMGKKTETQPGDNESLVGEVQTLVYGDKWLREFRDSVAKAIGMDYPTTNTFIVKRVEDIYKGWGELNDLIPKLRGEVHDLQNKYDDAESRFRFQSGLRQQWHARYESEHERANGVQKALDREREKCRVKDISLETAKKQYEKVCSNLETAECALNGMKSKVRELREEKTKVISAIGQDIWDDAVK